MTNKTFRYHKTEKDQQLLKFYSQKVIYLPQKHFKKYLTIKKKQYHFKLFFYFRMKSIEPKKLKDTKIITFFRTDGYF